MLAIEFQLEFVGAEAGFDEELQIYEGIRLDEGLYGSPKLPDLADGDFELTEVISVGDGGAANGGVIADFKSFI